MTKKKALITGITGQDGSYLAEELLERGYEVHGLVRRVALEDPGATDGAHFSSARQDHASSRQSGKLSQHFSHRQSLRFRRVLSPCGAEFRRREFCRWLLDDEHKHQRHALHAGGVARAAAEVSFLLRRFERDVRQSARGAADARSTPFHPRSPYGISKVAGFDLTRNYREAYDMFCVSGILFNHEGPRRGFEFVTRKISNTVARIKLGLATELRLGNLEAQRDWGHAKDYVHAMYLMLQQPEPDDYVVATGEAHSVANFASGPLPKLVWIIASM